MRRSWMSYKGRNRYGTVLGIELTVYPDKVRLNPINIRGTTESCHIDVPHEMARGLAAQLVATADLLGWKDSVVKTGEAWLAQGDSEVEGSSAGQDNHVPGTSAQADSGGSADDSRV